MKRSLSLPVAAIGAVVLGVAGFGAGFAVRAATNDDTPSASVATFPSNQNGGGATGAPDVANNIPGFAGAGRDVKVAADSDGLAYGENDASIMPACSVDLPVTITATGVDLASAGIDIRPLGSAFVPQSFSVRSVGDCIDGDDGTPVPSGDGKVVIDTTWRHVDTGVQVTVTQQLADDSVANVIRQGQASFTDGGYTFTVWANSFYYYGAKEGIDPAISSREPSILPGEQDPRVAEVLNAAISDLAPNFDDQCFAREVQGDWDDLAAFGLGDPRPAIPSDAQFQGMTFVYINPAAVDCGGGELSADRGLQFSANWYVNDKAGMSVSVYAGGLGAGEGGWNLGQINEYSANWQSRNISFSIYGNTSGGSGIGADVIRAIATAFDPSFDETCFLTESTFRGGDLGRYGVNAPVLPDGYKLGEERGSTYILRDGCEKPEGYVADSMSYWATYQDENGNVISIGMDRSPYGKIEAGQGYVGPGNIYFATGDGIMVSLSGYNQQGGEAPSIDVLKEIGRSIDPSVDYDALDSGNMGGGIAVAPPAPVDGGPTNSAD